MPQKPAGEQPVHATAVESTGLPLVKVVPELGEQITGMRCRDDNARCVVVDGERVRRARTGVGGPIELLGEHLVGPVGQRGDGTVDHVHAGPEVLVVRLCTTVAPCLITTWIVVSSPSVWPAPPEIVGVVFCADELLAGVTRVTAGATWSLSGAAVAWLLGLLVPIALNACT